MSPDEQRTLREWMESRFDKLDDRMRSEMKVLAEEIVETRHSLKPQIEVIALDLSATTQETRQNTKRISQINEWRGDGGVLDERFQRGALHVEETAASLRMQTEQVAASLRAQTETTAAELRTQTEDRFSKVNGRVEEIEKWRNTVRGALIVASVAIPIATGVATGLSLLIVSKLTGS